MPIESCIVNGINLSAKDCTTVFSPPGIIEQVMANPLFWIAIIAIIAFFIINSLRPKSKEDPSTKPMFGYFFRMEWLKRMTNRKLMIWGRKVKLHIIQGASKVGLADRVQYDEHILYDKVITNKRTREFEYKSTGIVTIDTFRFRKYGFISWLKALFGFGFEYISLTQDAHQILPGKNHKAMFLFIDPGATLLNDSGIWTVNDRRLIDHNYETILKLDDENIHGFQIDMLRRLAVHQASTAQALEKMSHESALKEKERKARNSPYE